MESSSHPPTSPPTQAHRGFSRPYLLKGGGGSTGIEATNLQDGMSPQHLPGTIHSSSQVEEGTSYYPSGFGSSE